MIDFLVEPEALGDSRVRGVPQDDLSATDQDRNLGGPDLKPIEQVLRVAIAIEVEVLKWMAVSRQKLLDAKRARAVRRPDDDDVAEIALNQR